MDIIKKTRKDVVMDLTPLVNVLMFFVVVPAAAIFLIHQQFSDPLAVLCIVVVGVCGPFEFMLFLAPKLVPKWAIRSYLRKEIEEIGSSILLHPKNSEDERARCEAKVRKAEATLKSLPDKQASRLNELQKTLAEMKNALAGLK